MSKIESITIGTDSLDVVRHDGRGWVVLKRACENVGLAYEPQFTKLKSAAWATVTIIVTVGEDGKSREMTCLSMDSVPMWLVTIQPSRVSDEVRSKLELYQKEASRVLADWFYGRRDPMTQAELMLANAQMLVDQERRQRALEAKQEAQEAEQRAQAAALQQHSDELAELKAARDEANSALLELPPPDRDAPEKSLRAALSDRAWRRLQVRMGQALSRDSAPLWVQRGRARSQLETAQTRRSRAAQHAADRLRDRMRGAHVIALYIRRNQ